MQQIPVRIKIEVFEFCGKYQAVSKYGKSAYYDTEIEAVNKCKEIIKAYRELINKQIFNDHADKLLRNSL